MSGSWKVGEIKERPGVYRRSENAGGAEIAGAADGVALAVVSGTWGAVNTPVRIGQGTSIASVIGTGSGANVIRELRTGGVNEIVVVRVGSGGTNAEVTLSDSADTPESVVKLTTLYPTSRDFSVSIREALDDETLKQAIIYDGTQDLETVSFDAGTNEVDGLIAALQSSKYVTAVKVAEGNGTLAIVNQSVFTGGSDPNVETEDYGNGFEAAEEESWDGVAIDSEEMTVFALLHAFIERKFEEGEYPYAGVAEKKSVALDTRIQHALTFNDEKMHYILNSWVATDGTVYEGYLAAARIVGSIVACASNESLTHTVVAGAERLNEKLTNSEINRALRSGCIVFTLSRSTRQVWIEKAINTLVTLPKDKDQGWKKIRRMKTRFELMSRIDRTIEPMVGPVDNDADGRAAVIAAMQEVVDTMAGEKKLMPNGTVYLDPENAPRGEYAWFCIAVDDIDSMETIYLTYRYRFTSGDSEE